MSRSCARSSARNGKWRKGAIMNTRIDISLSRREFLKASGALIVCASMPGLVGEALAQAGVAAAGKPAVVPDELDSWVAVLPDGRIAAFFEIGRAHV